MSQEEDIWAVPATRYCDEDGVEYARGTPHELASQIKDLRKVCDMLTVVLDAHRRFHSKVGCPGLPECLACAAEQARDDYAFPAKPFPK